MHHLMIEMQHADFTLPEHAAEINVLEMLYQTPFSKRETTHESATALDEITTVDARELISALATFTVDVSCELIALAAAMPFVPRIIGKPIYRPLVRRLLA